VAAHYEMELLLWVILVDRWVNGTANDDYLFISEVGVPSNNRTIHAN
jgi:hypothetical protein